jgi:predicted lipid-binding transport protein (Tim44 family)
MTPTMISNLACGSGHSVSTGLRAVEVVGVLLGLAGAISLVIGLTQRFAAAKQPSPPFPGHAAAPPAGAAGDEAQGDDVHRAGAALIVLGLLCFLFVSLLMC